MNEQSATVENKVGKSMLHNRAEQVSIVNAHVNCGVSLGNVS